MSIRIIRVEEKTTGTWTFKLSFEVLLFAGKLVAKFFSNGWYVFCQKVVAPKTLSSENFIRSLFYVKILPNPLAYSIHAILLSRKRSSLDGISRSGCHLYVFFI